MQTLADDFHLIFTKEIDCLDGQTSALGNVEYFEYLQNKMELNNLS